MTYVKLRKKGALGVKDLELFNDFIGKMEVETYKRQI